jgi:hypothetical protein
VDRVEVYDHDSNILGTVLEQTVQDGIDQSKFWQGGLEHQWFRAYSTCHLFALKVGAIFEEYCHDEGAITNNLVSRGFVTLIVFTEEDNFFALAIAKARR